MNSVELPDVEVLGEFDHGMCDPIVREKEGRSKQQMKKATFPFVNTFMNVERAFDKATKKVCDGVGHMCEGVAKRRGSYETPEQSHYREGYDAESCTDVEWILFYGLERS